MHARIVLTKPLIAQAKYFAIVLHVDLTVVAYQHAMRSFIIRQTGSTYSYTIRKLKRLTIIIMSIDMF